MRENARGLPRGWSPSTAPSVFMPPPRTGHGLGSPCRHHGPGPPERHRSEQLPAGSAGQWTHHRAMPVGSRAVADHVVGDRNLAPVGPDDDRRAVQLADGRERFEERDCEMRSLMPREAPRPAPDRGARSTPKSLKAASFPSRYTPSSEMTVAGRSSSSHQMSDSGARATCWSR
jgi:hypothetical protein